LEHRYKFPHSRLFFYGHDAMGAFDRFLISVLRKPTRQRIIMPPMHPGSFIFNAHAVTPPTPPGGFIVTSTKVSRTTNLALAGGLQIVPWSSADFNDLSAWNAGDPTKLTIPTTGLYILTGTVLFDNSSNTGTYRAVQIKNGSTVIKTFSIGLNSFTQATTIPITLTFKASAAAIITIVAISDSVGVTNVLGDANGSTTTELTQLA
jgi:hypothetical protein